MRYSRISTAACGLALALAKPLGAAAAEPTTGVANSPTKSYDSGFFVNPAALIDNTLVFGIERAVAASATIFFGPSGVYDKVSSGSSNILVRGIGFVIKPHFYLKDGKFRGPYLAPQLGGSFMLQNVDMGGQQTSIGGMTYAVGGTGGWAFVFPHQIALKIGVGAAWVGARFFSDKPELATTSFTGVSFLGDVAIGIVF